jgi:hypothetical protein
MVAVDVRLLALAALLNREVIAVAIVMGRRAEQWRTGVILYWIAPRFDIAGVSATGRAAAALFAARLVFGLIYAWLPHRFARWPPT